MPRLGPFLFWAIASSLFVVVSVPLVLVAAGYYPNVRSLRLERLGAIEVSSEPSGASIFLDGRYQGKTGKLIRGLRPGAVRVRLERAGFSPYEAQVSVNPGQVTKLRALLFVAELVFEEVASESLPRPPPVAKELLDRLPSDLERDSIEPLNGELLIRSGSEFWLFEPKKQARWLIARFSRPPLAAHVARGLPGLFYLLEEGEVKELRLLEWEIARDVSLFHLPGEVTDFRLSEGARFLFFEKEGRLFRARIR